MKNKHFLLLLFITAILLMVIALYNGYPLTEADTGAYIQQAIYPHFAADRSPFYGIFIRVTSLWTSLWFPVFAQCLLLSFLLLQYIQRLQKDSFSPGSAPFSNILSGKTFLLTLFTVITIISFTCVTWVSAYLMPDIFGGILLLGALLYLSAPAGSTKLQWVYVIIISGAIAIHNSHFLITGVFSTILLLSALIKKQPLLVKRSAILLSLCAIVWVTMCSMNAAKKYGFTFSRGKDIFMVAKFAETGVLNVYLDENCGKKNLKLCSYKEQIPPGLSEFLWDGESPLYKMGGWDSCSNEYKTITHDILTTPRYLKMFARKSLISTLRQLTQVQAPDKVNAEGKDMQPWKKIKQFFADEFREYNQSLQNNNQLSATSCNFIYYLFFVLSSLWVLFYNGVINKELSFIYKCILLFLVVNAFVMSTFSTVIYRFQYRIFWILPATNAIIIIRHYWYKSMQYTLPD